MNTIIEGDFMDAVELLTRLENINACIKNTSEDIADMKNVAYGLSGRKTEEKVQTTANPHKMENAIVKYINIEENELEALLQERKHIIDTLKRLNTKHYDFLHKRYVMGLGLEDIANEEGYSYAWASTTHCRAKESLQKLLNEREHNGT